MSRVFNREISLVQATALNMIDMVGIGPFATLPIVLLAFPGKFSLIPWLAGAIVSLFDGWIWSELGAAWPEAGGSYIFLQRIYKSAIGRYLAFLYSFQTSLHLPLVMTSACIGLLNYLNYLVPLSFWQGKAVMVSVVALITFLLYRRVVAVAQIGMVFSVLVVGLLLWTIGTGCLGFSKEVWLANSVTPIFLRDGWRWATAFAIGAATSKTVYAFLGYYNVCHLGGEITSPKKNIPRSIFISIVGIATLYLGMQAAVAGALPATLITNENTPVISLLFERMYGALAAKVATVLILLVCISSLFALLLGYTRIIYAAAADGLHFRWLAHLHPTKNFPDYALLFFAGVAMVFCLLFDQPSVVFRFIVVTRIFIQFIPQAIGVIWMRKQNRTPELAFQMPLFPVPALLSVLFWLLLFITSGYLFASAGIAVIVVASLLYLLFFLQKKV
ncbi:MAG: amino acid permease [Chitinophagales bacterium]